MKEATEILNSVDEIGKSLWKQQNVYPKIKDIIPELGKIYKEVIIKIERYGFTEVKINDLVRQLNNLKQGLENKDAILLADTFNYEVYNTINFYIDITRIEEEERENI